MSLPSPQVRLAQFRGSGFAGFLLSAFQDNLSRPSQESLLLLALVGWVTINKQHRLAAHVWHAGGTGFKHFDCIYTFLERSIYPQLDPFWCKVIVMAGQLVPESETVMVQFGTRWRRALRYDPQEER